MLGSLLNHRFNRNLSFQIGSSLESSNIKTYENTFLYDSTFYGLGNFSFLNLYTGITYDSRDNIGFPHNGYFIDFSISYAPELLNNPALFLRSRIDIRTYFENEFITNNTLSFKAIGELLNGDYPFFKGASLGGSKSLRGHPSNRFVGDASLFFQSELRIYHRQTPDIHSWSFWNKVIC